MTEDEKAAEITRLALDAALAAEQYERLGRINLSTLTPEQRSVLTIEYTVARNKMLRANQLLSNTQFNLIANGN